MILILQWIAFNFYDKFYFFNDSLVYETFFLGRHYEIVRLISVIDNILQIDAGRLTQVVEKLLRKHKRHAALFLDLRFGSSAIVGKIGRDADGELFSKFFAIKSGQGVASAVRTYDTVERARRQMRSRRY